MNRLKRAGVWEGRLVGKAKRKEGIDVGWGDQLIGVNQLPVWFNVIKCLLSDNNYVTNIV